MFLPGTIICRFSGSPRRPGEQPAYHTVRIILLIPAVIRARSSSCCGSGCTTTRSARSIISGRRHRPVHAAQRTAMAGRHGADPSIAVMELVGARLPAPSSFSPAWPPSPRICRTPPASTAPANGRSSGVIRPRLAPHDDPGRPALRHRHGGDRRLIFGGFNRASPTYTWTIFMYDQAFKQGLWRQGYASAIGMIGAVALMIVMVFLIRIFRSLD